MSKIAWYWSNFALIAASSSRVGLHGSAADGGAASRWDRMAFTSHDLYGVEYISERGLLLYLGQVVDYESEVPIHA